MPDPHLEQSLQGVSQMRSGMRSLREIDVYSTPMSVFHLFRGKDHRVTHDEVSHMRQAMESARSHNTMVDFIKRVSEQDPELGKKLEGRYVNIVSGLDSSEGKKFDEMMNKMRDVRIAAYTKGPDQTIEQSQQVIKSVFGDLVRNEEQLKTLSATLAVSQHEEVSKYSVASSRFAQSVAEKGGIQALEELTGEEIKNVEESINKAEAYWLSLGKASLQKYPISEEERQMRTSMFYEEMRLLRQQGMLAGAGAYREDKHKELKEAGEEHLKELKRQKEGTFWTRLWNEHLPNLAIYIGSSAAVGFATGGPVGAGGGTVVGTVMGVGRAVVREAVGPEAALGYDIVSVFAGGGGLVKAGIQGAGAAAKAGAAAARAEAAVARAEAAAVRAESAAGQAAAATTRGVGEVAEAAVKAEGKVAGQAAGRAGAAEGQVAGRAAQPSGSGGGGGGGASAPKTGSGSGSGSSSGGGRGGGGGEGGSRGGAGEGGGRTGSGEGSGRSGTGEGTGRSGAGEGGGPRGGQGGRGPQGGRGSGGRGGRSGRSGRGGRGGRGRRFLRRAGRLALGLWALLGSLGDISGRGRPVDFDGSGGGGGGLGDGGVGGDDWDFDSLKGFSFQEHVHDISERSPLVRRMLGLPLDPIARFSGLTVDMYGYMAHLFTPKVSGTLSGNSVGLYVPPAFNYSNAAHEHLSLKEQRYLGGSSGEGGLVSRMAPRGGM